MNVTITDIPFETKEKKRSWESLLKTLREYKQNQEDLDMVKEAKKSQSNGISLQDYLETRWVN